MVGTAFMCAAVMAAALVPAESARLATTEPAAVQATAADAAPFLGDWTLTLEGPNGPGTFELAVKVEKDKVVGEISVPTVGTQPISEVSKTEKSLVLRYTFNYEGNPVDAAVSLTPADNGKVAAEVSFAGGAYVMTGVATKKDKAKQ